MSRINLIDLTHNILEEVEPRKPPKISLYIQYLKWVESALYPDESDYQNFTNDLIISISLEVMRKEVIELDDRVDSYFENISDSDDFYIEFDGMETDFPGNSDAVEDLMRDRILTPKVLTFYNYYLETLKIHQAFLLVSGVFGRSFTEQDEAQDFLYSELSYDQREYLLYYSGLIDDDLRSKMARIRSRRRNLVHTIEAGYLDTVDHSINDLHICVDVMQQICDLSHRETALGSMDSIVDAFS